MATEKLDRAALKAKLVAEFEATLDRVADAVDAARFGAVINDSEEPCRQALDDFKRTVFESAIQLKSDAAEAAFSPSAGRNRQEDAS